MLEPRPHPRRSLLAASVIILSAMLLACAKAPEKVVVTPEVLDSVLVNPGMGFTTFYSFNGDERNANHPECSIAYFRWYWKDLEPREGEVNFGLIDSILALCHSHGQRLAFRVMCQNGHEDADKSQDDALEVPRWFHDSSPGFLYPDKRHWQPDYDSPRFLEAHGRLIRALGARYDGHPNLDHVDIGSVGRWGEWHTSGLNLPMPRTENSFKVIDFYLESFKRTPLVMNVDEGPALDYALEQGTGWRADCLGDFRPGWSHMRVAYPALFEDHPQIRRAWEHAPVAFETCWNMLHWQEMGWDPDSIFATALAWHVSVLNNKSFPVPDLWWPQVRQFEKKMGYRFVLHSLEHPSSVKSGESAAVVMDWENAGVAPCYRFYPLTFELRPESGGEATLVRTAVDIRRWLPGPRRELVPLEVPAGLAPGGYSLGLALADSASGAPMVRLAIAGRDPDGWYRLSRIEVK